MCINNYNINHNLYFDEYARIYHNDEIEDKQNAFAKSLRANAKDKTNKDGKEVVSEIKKSDRKSVV